MNQAEGVLAVGITEAARRLGLSARTIATLVKRGDLESRKIGRRRLIPTSVLAEFIRRDHRYTHIGPEETIQGSNSSAE
jgi:excisionase family DNA binding protein